MSSLKVHEKDDRSSNQTPKHQHLAQQPDFGLDDDNVWERILDRYGPSAIGKCKKLVRMAGISQPEPKDCLQEAILRLLLRTDIIRFSCEAQLGKWLIVTACNYCRDEIKRQKSEASHEERIRLEHYYGTALRTDALELETDIDKFLAGLEPEDRFLLHAKFFLGMTSLEISVANNVEPSTVRTKIVRLLEKAKQGYEKSTPSRGTK